MAPSDKNEIYLSSSPHISHKATTTKIMLCVIIALLPVCVSGVVLYGVPALTTILVSVVSCFVFEFLFRKLTHQKTRCGDLSAIVTGLLLALVLPPEFPVWMTILGALFAIVVAKEFFGGLGANVFNPALTGRAFLLVSFPAAMSSWHRTAFTSLDALSSATPLISGMKGFSYLDMFLGNRTGCIGESSIALILLAFVFLLVTRIIDWRAPVAMIVTAVLYEWAFTGKSGLFSADPLFALMSGGLCFGAVFMTTDYTTAPVTAKGRLLFGFGCGLITALIRHFSGYPEGVMFSILIMNTIVSFLNKLTQRKYGYVSGKKGAASK